MVGQVSDMIYGDWRANVRVSCHMPLEVDFDPLTATQMREELARFSDKCFYDETTKRIVYYSAQEAFETYIACQIEAMERHKWIESEKSQCDLGMNSLVDWVQKYSEKFARYWRHTHRYIPPQDTPPSNS